MKAGSSVISLLVHHTIILSEDEYCRFLIDWICISGDLLYQINCTISYDNSSELELQIFLVGAEVKSRLLLSGLHSCGLCNNIIPENWRRNKFRTSEDLGISKALPIISAGALSLRSIISELSTNWCNHSMKPLTRHEPSDVAVKSAIAI